MTEIEQHNQEISENRRFWDCKPTLRRAYADFYKAIGAQTVSGLTVELGSGMGNIKQYIPECITTDIFPNPWLDRVESAYNLGFEDNTVSNLILFDVWHHLEFPADALLEFRRVIAPGGRVILLEPAMSLLGRMIYGRCHHEPLGSDIVFPQKPVGKTNIPARYFAAQSSAYRIFGMKQQPELLAGWNMLQFKHIVSFAYLGSGGFRGPQLYPEAFSPFVRLIDRALSCAPSAFAARILVTLEKNPH
jgi:hypothetical protein